MKAAAIALLAFLCLLNTGCISQIIEQNNAIMQSWVGQRESKLIAEWGPPPAVRDDGQGGRVLVYGNFNGAYRMFYVNSNGVIYYGRWQGR
jgi:hypothetical protein